MPTLLIRRAIAAHHAWCEQLDAAVHLRGAHGFDLERSWDDQGCEFGRWLQSEQGRQLVRGAARSNVERLHRRFHDAAYVIASLHKSQASHRDIQPFLVDLKGLSQQLVDVLERVVAAHEGGWCG